MERKGENSFHDTNVILYLYRKNMTFFVLGSHPALSLAEIAAVVGFKKDYSLASKEILLFDEAEQTPEFLQERLAGTIKIGGVVGEVKKFDQDEIADFIFSLLSPPSFGRRDKNDGNRIVFGLSAYACGGNKKRLSDEIKKLGMAIKKRIKKNGQTARFVDSKEPELSSAAIVGEKILENGGEFVLIVLPEKIVIGQTRTVQNFKSWSNRDYGRPARDAKSGMLPPKLARMMINLALTPNPSPGGRGKILDPFCGSGTVLMEAAMMGWPKIIGGDISDRAIKDTQKNLEWLQKNFEIGLPKIQLINQSVETLDQELKDRVDTIVTETFLGPPLTGRENQEKIKYVFSDLEKRAQATFLALTKLLKKDGVAVLALPVFKFGQENYYLPTKKLATAAGLSFIKILPENLPKEISGITPSGGLLYSRPKQRVGREIIKICFPDSTN